MRFTTLKIVIFLAIVLPFGYVFAANGTLYLSPESGIYAVGETFEVMILADSDGKEINAAEAELVFNPDELFVEDVSTDGSILNLWTIAPTFSNETGTIEFAGGTRENFIGDKGLLATVTFKALRSITSRANLAAGAILAADGKGSNIITSIKSGVYTLEPREILAQAEYLAQENTPLAPTIFSSTHPNQNEWYKKNTVQLDWEIPDGIIATRLLLNNLPKSIPSVLYEHSVKTKKIKNLSDGIWYFHAQMKNVNGWGEISHFRFQIDTERPKSFEIIKQLEDADQEGSQPKFFFDSTDKTSGIDMYEVQIDQNDTETWLDDGNHIYSPPPLDSGEYMLLAKAIDRAGNYLIDTASFTVEFLDPPILTEYPDVVNPKDVFVVRGDTLSNSRISVWVQKGGELPKRDDILSNKDGSFTFIIDRGLDDGVYYLWAEVYEENGAKSPPSDKIVFVVRPPLIVGLATVAVQFLSVFIPLLALLIVLGLFAGYSWYRIDKVKQRIFRKNKND